jgi:hypothetical protein
VRRCEGGRQLEVDGDDDGDRQKSGDAGGIGSGEVGDGRVSMERT